MARIDGSGSVEPHPAAAHALGGDAEQGKQASVPITNPHWADRFNVAAAANDEPGGSNTPNVRQGAGGEDIAQVYYFHTQPNGLPEELSDNSGNLVWTAQYTTWGSTVSEQWQSFDTAGRPQHQLASQTASLQQNLRMQGQYLDRETGLHYNTFRYYDADLGAFTTPDPIGLNGGLNLHQYAPNPISWIDPWGWERCGTNHPLKWNGSRDREGLTRKDHVRRHGEDIPNRNVPHGVFSGNPINQTAQAWKIAKDQGIQPVIQPNGNLAYTVPMRNAGIQGGSASHPDHGKVLNNVLIITKPNSNQVVTSYPVL